MLLAHFVAAFIIFGSPFIYGLTQPNLYIWPKVTECPGCVKTIYVWQDQERRDESVKVEGDPSNFALSASSSSLYHNECPMGKPMTITVRTEQMTDDELQKWLRE